MKAIEYHLHNCCTHLVTLHAFYGGICIHYVFSLMCQVFPLCMCRYQKLEKLDWCLFHRTTFQFVLGCGLTPHITCSFSYSQHPLWFYMFAQ